MDVDLGLTEQVWGQGISGNSLNFLLNFSVSLKLLKKETLLVKKKKRKKKNLKSGMSPSLRCFFRVAAIS